VSKNLSRGRSSSRDRERTNTDYNNNAVFPQNGHSMKVHIDLESDQIMVHDGQKNVPSEHLSEYNNLLKVGR